MNSKIYFNQIIFLLLIPILLFSQEIRQSRQQSINTQFPLLNKEDIISLSSSLQSKVLSGKILPRISPKKKVSKNSISFTEVITEKVVVYVAESPPQRRLPNLRKKCKMLFEP